MKYLKSLFAVMILGFSSHAFAETLVCHQQIDDSRTRTVVVSDRGIFLVCESPSDVNLDPTVRKNYCAAAALVISNSTKSTTNGLESGILVGTTHLSILNSVPDGVAVEFSYSYDSKGAVTGHLKLSSGNLSATPALNLPLDTDYSCNSQ